MDSKLILAYIIMLLMAVIIFFIIIKGLKFIIKRDKLSLYILFVLVVMVIMFVFAYLILGDSMINYFGRK